MRVIVHLIEIVGKNRRRCADSRLVLRLDQRSDELVWDEGRMRLHAVATRTGTVMPDVHKTTDEIMSVLATHSLRSGSMITLMFLPDEFRCRSQVEFVDARFLSVEINALSSAS